MIRPKPLSTAAGAKAPAALVAALALCLVLSLTVTFPAAAASFPKPQGAVNDFAGVLNSQTEAGLRGLAAEVLQKTGTAMVVATFKSTNGEDMATFSNDLYSAWGIGKKGEDKGLLLVVAVKDRQMRIETGYGVEGVLPDGLLGRIRDSYILPYFKKGDYSAGVANGMLAMAQVLAKDAGVTLSGESRARAVKTKKNTGGLGGAGLIVIIAIFLLFSRRRRGRGGVLPWIILGSMMGGGGRGGGGGFGGGGFGGFGGGMSGGGGVGGSW